MQVCFLYWNWKVSARLLDTWIWNEKNSATCIGRQRKEMNVGATSGSDESYVNHEGGEIGCVLVPQRTATEYDPPPTYRQCDLHVRAWTIE